MNEHFWHRLVLREFGLFLYSPIVHFQVPEEKSSFSREKLVVDTEDESCDVKELIRKQQENFECEQKLLDESQGFSQEELLELSIKDLLDRLAVAVKCGRSSLPSKLAIAITTKCQRNSSNSLSSSPTSSPSSHETPLRPVSPLSIINFPAYSSLPSIIELKRPFDTELSQVPLDRKYTCIYPTKFGPEASKQTWRALFESLSRVYRDAHLFHWDSLAQYFRDSPATCEGITKMLEKPAPNTVMFKHVQLLSPTWPNLELSLLKNFDYLKTFYFSRAGSTAFKKCIDHKFLSSLQGLRCTFSLLDARIMLDVEITLFWRKQRSGTSRQFIIDDTALQSFRRLLAHEELIDLLGGTSAIRVVGLTTLESES